LPIFSAFRALLRLLALQLASALTGQCADRCLGVGDPVSDELEIPCRGVVDPVNGDGLALDQRPQRVDERLPNPAGAVRLDGSACAEATADVPEETTAGATSVTPEINTAATHINSRRNGGTVPDLGRNTATSVIFMHWQTPTRRGIIP
jgi:hypothetical protein